MRVIAGEHRGRRLAAPDGSGTRPTTDRVKESMMSALVSVTGGFEGLCVLDAFAGSGALGIECISRGAGHVLFCESAPAAARVVEKNLRDLEVAPSRFSLARIDVFKRPPAAVLRPFDLVLLDPPYACAASEAWGLLRALQDRGSLAPGAIVCYEHDARAELSASLAQETGLILEPHASKRMRDVSYDVFSIASTKGGIS